MMKFKIKKTLTALVTALMLLLTASLPAFAEGGFECTITYDADAISINLSGFAPSSVTAYVYDSTTTPGEFSSINIPRALWQHNIKRYSQFNFDVKLGDDLPNGEYIAVASCGDSKVTYTFKHLNSETANLAVEAVNSAVKDGAEAVKSALCENASLLMIDEEELAGYVDVAAGIISGRKLNFDKYTELFDMIEECKVIRIIINAEDDEVIGLVVQNAASLGVDLETYYNPLPDEAKDFIADKISDDETYKTESFSVGFERLSALAKVACASKWQDIRDAITDTHKDVIGIKTSGISNLDKIFREMMNCSYSEFDDIKENFDKCKNEINSGASSSNKSGGSSTGGGVPVIGNTSGQTDNVKEDEKSEASAKPVFSDVAADHWAKPAIDNLVAKGVLSGYDDKTFRPANNITRAEFVKMIVGAFSIAGSAELPFDDVEQDAWYKSYLSAAYGAGIISGTGANSFEPASFITRQDASLIIYRIIKDKLPKGGELGFADNDEIAAYALDAIAALSDGGIINGVGESRFAPRAHIDRQSAAVLIYNCLNN